jgi:hypothetical protein
VNSTEQPALPEARAKITSLIAGRGNEEQDRYAALLSRCRTRAAHELIYQVFREAADWRSASSAPTGNTPISYSCNKPVGRR